MFLNLKFCQFNSFVLGLVVALPLMGVAQDEDIAEAVAEASTTTTSEPSSKLRPLTITAALFDDTKITGTLTDSTAINIRTAFGEASIPLAEVAGIRFPGRDDSSTTVVMLNGDSITGSTNLKFVSVETTWGSAKINGQNIASMMFVPGLQWQNNDSLGGKRWALVEGAVATPVQSSSSRSSTSPSQPSPSSSILQNSQIQTSQSQGLQLPPPVSSSSPIPGQGYPSVTIPQGPRIIYGGQ